MPDTSIQIPAWEASSSVATNIAANLEVIDNALLLPEVNSLITAWGLVGPTDEPAEFLEWLSAVADEHWDFRRGRERNQVGEIKFSEAQNQAIKDASTVLGLRTPTAPVRTHYDSIFVLGGLLRGCLTRWRTAKELVDAGLDVTAIIGLGGTRVLTSDEVEQGELLGVGGTTEFEAMTAALRCTFSLRGSSAHTAYDDPNLPNANWAITSFDSSTPRLAIVAAPSSEPEKRRANTADTIEWWLQQSGSAQQQSNLLITHQIYVPYQAAVAVCTLGLPKNTTVELVGVTKTAEDLGEITQRFEQHNYLQEIGSTIRGYRQLRKALIDAQRLL